MVDVPFNGDISPILGMDTTPDVVEPGDKREPSCTHTVWRRGATLGIYPQSHHSSEESGAGLEWSETREAGSKGEGDGEWD